VSYFKKNFGSYKYVSAVIEIVGDIKCRINFEQKKMFPPMLVSPATFAAVDWEQAT
jgi:hypothetical protein